MLKQIRYLYFEEGGDNTFLKDTWRFLEGRTNVKKKKLNLNCLIFLVKESSVSLSKPFSLDRKKKTFEALIYSDSIEIPNEKPSKTPSPIGTRESIYFARSDQLISQSYYLVEKDKIV